MFLLYFHSLLVPIVYVLCTLVHNLFATIYTIFIVIEKEGKKKKKKKKNRIVMTLA